MRKRISNSSSLRRLAVVFAVPVCLFLLSVCAFAAEGELAGKSTSMALIYGLVTLVALALAIAYCVCVRKKDLWLLLLHFAIVVVNVGYFTMSLSKSLDEALLANRIAYFGSAYLPLFMLLAIMDACRARYRKWMLALLLTVSTLAFLLAASPGYLNCYYRDVTLVFVNGVACLSKVYGPLHKLYSIYLLVYIGLMIGVIIASVAKKRISAPKYAILLLTVVLQNIAIWLVEQLIYVEFEFLSISYIISELLLLLLYSMLQDMGVRSAAPVEPAAEEVPEKPLKEELEARLRLRCPAAQTLTAREWEVLQAILENKKRRAIAEELCVSENTVKKHTSHIFMKLEVSSRSELFEKLQ